ncbi:nucleotide sugar dehydrogenase [Planktomarina temperata]|nr:nucleotide sugar dehydrogenase [Planktomarina temperata]
MNEKYNVCVIGLGYVGLPLAVALSEKYEVIGIDTNKSRISSLINYIDNTNEFSVDDMKCAFARGLKISDAYFRTEQPTVFIVTVPTPVTTENLPDLSLVHSACKSIGKILKKNDIVVFESTVYPGATREEFIPIVEKESVLTGAKDFYYGYSPERINPSDKMHNLQNVVKVVAGCSSFSLRKITEIYSEIVEAGIYQAESIEVAEAAKVLENTQRDINIALMNEVSIIFHALNINTKQVLKAASTKWNFLQFTPGLVGGHCIGVDPYYLIHQSQLHGYDPTFLSASRKVNESISDFIVKELLSCAESREISLEDKPVLILGATFKPDCPDLRNSKVLEICNILQKMRIHTLVIDPVANESYLGGHRITANTPFSFNKFSAVILAVPHKSLIELVKREMQNGDRPIIFFDLYSAVDCENNFEL